MKKAEVVTDDKGNIYIVPGRMTREEAEAYFPNQPERSKREDLNFKQLSDEFWNSHVTKDLVMNSEEEQGALKVIDKFSEWLDSRCGALNSMET